jgi:hypothetical protein
MAKTCLTETTVVRTPSWPQLCTHGLAGLVILGVIGGAFPPSQSRPVLAPQAPHPAAATPAKATTLDDALRFTAQAKTAYAKVNDYTCRFIKRERDGGQLTPTHVVEMKLKERPFSVHLRWTEPRDMAAQEVCYVDGKNNGEMRVKPTGLLSTLGWVDLSPDDPRARKSSRYRITEAGIGRLIDRLARCWEEEKKLGLSTVGVATYEYDGKRCDRVDIVRDSRARGRVEFSRTIVFFDRTTGLPIRLEHYLWPARPGQPAELAESFSYAALRLNVGLRDAEFVK